MFKCGEFGHAIVLSYIGVAAIKNVVLIRNVQQLYVLFGVVVIEGYSRGFNKIVVGERHIFDVHFIHNKKALVSYPAVTTVEPKLLSFIYFPLLFTVIGN